MIIYQSDKEFIEVLKKLKSWCKSKSVILYSDVFKLGFLKIKLSYTENLKLIHDLILDVFYDFEIIVPVFNYDFLVTKVYDVRRDKSQVGALNEYFRNIYILSRTYTPVFNVVTTNKNSILKILPISNGENLTSVSLQMSYFSDYVDELSSTKLMPP